MVKIEWKKNLLLALPVTFAVWLVGFLMLKLNLGAVGNLFAAINVPATSTVTPTFATKIAMLGGLVPSTEGWMALLVLFISAFITLIIGELIVDLLFKGKTLGNIMGLGDAGKLATFLLLGALVGYLIFVGLKLPGLLTFAGVLIHTVLIVVVTVLVVKLLKMKI